MKQPETKVIYVDAKGSMDIETKEFTPDPEETIKNEHNILICTNAECGWYVWTDESDDGVCPDSECNFPMIHYTPYSTLTEMKSEKDRLEKALKDVKKHQEIVGGKLGVMGTTWKIANDALKGNKHGS